MTKRRSMTAARKRRIHEREEGKCWHCRLPVPMTGPDVRYDHVQPLWITGDDSDDAIKPAHTTCDKPKTAIDQKTIAKLKRIIAREDGTRRPRKAIPSRGFGDQSRPIPSRPFHKRKS